MAKKPKALNLSAFRAYYLDKTPSTFSDDDQLRSMLLDQEYHPCHSSAKSSIGFISPTKSLLAQPFPKHADELHFRSGGFTLLCVRRGTKAIDKDLLNERMLQIEKERLSRNPGAKMSKKEIRESAEAVLLPTTTESISDTYMVVSPHNNLVLVGTGSENTATDCLDLLRSALSTLPVAPFNADPKLGMPALLSNLLAIHLELTTDTLVKSKDLTLLADGDTFKIREPSGEKPAEISGKNAGDTLDYKSYLDDRGWDVVECSLTCDINDTRACFKLKEDGAFNGFGFSGLKDSETVDEEDYNSSVYTLLDSTLYLYGTMISTITQAISTAIKANPKKVLCNQSQAEIKAEKAEQKAAAKEQAKAAKKKAADESKALKDSEKAA